MLSEEFGEFMTTRPPALPDRQFSLPVVHVSREERNRGQLTADRFRAAALSLHTHGYAILKGAVCESLAREAAAQFASVLHDCQRSREGDAWYQTSAEFAAVFWERNSRWRIFPKLQGAVSDARIVANPFAMPVVRFFLGDDFYCKFVSSDTCLKGARLQSPHRELGAGESWQPGSYVVNIPLCECTLDNGPLEVWPGTGHLWRNEFLDRLNFCTEPQDEENPETMALAESLPSCKLTFGIGDLLIRDPGLLHRGTVNVTDAPRSLLTLCYFRQGKDHDYGRWEYNLDEQSYQQLAPEVKQLFPQAVRRFESATVSETTPAHSGMTSISSRASKRGWTRPTMASHDSADANSPRVAVVATLTFPRGQVRNFLAGWENQQDVPRDRIELILVSNGTNPGLEEQVRERLHAHDRLVRAPGLSEPELYNLGVNHANAEWVLITEPHVVASADCLKELLRTVTQSQLEGACVHTLPAEDENWVAECESRMYAGDLEILSDPDDWRKITKRGTLFRRRTFFAAGGFPAKYGAYCEMALAAELSQQGRRLGFASRATIRHFNSTDLKELLDYIWDYRQGACLFQQDDRDDALTRSPSVHALAARRFHPQHRRTIRNCVWQSLIRGITKRRPRRFLRSMLKTWTLLGVPGLPTYWNAARLWIGCWLTRCRLPWEPPGRRYERFMDLWARWGDLAELWYRAAEKSRWPQAAIPLEGVASVSAADLPLPATLGVHQLEESHGQTFRWLEPVACFCFEGKPASFIVSLEFLERKVPLSQIRAFWNETLLHPMPGLRDNELSFQILPGHFTASDRQLLTLISPPQRTSRNQRRPLGIPLTNIGLQPTKLTPGQMFQLERAVA
jgi:GT2 family glycosyltransferase/ectoine hydroxylase-related dioxygenase (phytanoyl-CoA dioxygenase family)